jgi:hypothetical protein
MQPPVGGGTSGTATRMVARLGVGEAFYFPSARVGVIFASLDTASDTGVVHLVGSPIIATQPAGTLAGVGLVCALPRPVRNPHLPHARSHWSEPLSLLCAHLCQICVGVCLRHRLPCVRCVWLLCVMPSVNHR